MIKRLTTIGKSKGLILDKTMLGLLGLTDSDEVSLHIDGTRLIIEPAYKNPIEEIRARLRDNVDHDAADRLIADAAKAARVGSVRALKAGRGR